MKIDTSSANEADIVMEQGETLYFSLKYLRGREFGVPAIPPCPFGSPVARIIHGCYWLGRYRSGSFERRVKLTGPTVVGNFRAVTIESGQSMFINCENLVGFSFGSGGALQTKISQMLSPTMWAIGHPLPVLAIGPARVILYGEGLKEIETEPGAEYVPNQVVSFHAATPFIARALIPDSGVVSHISNAVGRQSRIVFPERSRILLLPINKPDRIVSQMAMHLVIHLGIVALLIFLFKL
jgi:hypothetical protein